MYDDKPLAKQPVVSSPYSLPFSFSLSLPRGDTGRGRKRSYLGKLSGSSASSPRKCLPVLLPVVRRFCNVCDATVRARRGITARNSGSVHGERFPLLHAVNGKRLDFVTTTITLASLRADYLDALPPRSRRICIGSINREVRANISNACLCPTRSAFVAAFRN